MPGLIGEFPLIWVVREFFVPEGVGEVNNTGGDCFSWVFGLVIHLGTLDAHCASLFVV